MMGPKVPFMKDGILNLLNVADVTPDERHRLIAMGYGDLLKHQKGAITSSGVHKNQIDLELEKVDQKRASVITFNFITFRPSPHADPTTLPERIYIRLRFFTFPDCQTADAQLHLPGDSN